jgi:hypothetical protein
MSVSDGFAPVAVGVTVSFCAMMGGPLTGASMNPARSLGPALAGGGWSGHWLNWAAPITGMIGGAWSYEFLRPASAHPVDSSTLLGVQGSVREHPAVSTDGPTESAGSPVATVPGR